MADTNKSLKTTPNGPGPQHQDANGDFQFTGENNPLPAIDAAAHTRLDTLEASQQQILAKLGSIGGAVDVSNFPTTQQVEGNIQPTGISTQEEASSVLVPAGSFVTFNRELDGTAVSISAKWSSSIKHQVKIRTTKADGTNVGYPVVLVDKSSTASLYSDTQSPFNINARYNTITITNNDTVDATIENLLITTFK